ncbi:EAL domain-containing protein [Arthrobacter sp. 260]|uniref:sensor domain-containing protein n=1 Tax=Arthrobacter sp. 260 TaxID=2735314 RepID=UPI0014915DEC|nr:EAL domain-containing protein [Arthrobacter sp. 260]NOJ60217.1 EAL domain-containing protein [Arthrobacter sp. 260]
MIDHGAPGSDERKVAVIPDAKAAALFESIVVNANDVVLVTRAEPVDLLSGGPEVLYVNPAFTRMTGYEAHEIVGKTPRILQSPKTDRAELDRLRAALKAWEPVEVELLNIHKDGQEFWVQINITPVANARGWFTHWVAIQRDITHRKHRELAVQTMLANTSDLLIILDDGKRIASLSPSSEQLLGAAGHTHVGEDFLTLVHPQDRKDAHGFLTAPAGLRLGRSAIAELRLRHGDGRWRWFEVSVADLDASGNDPDSALVLACSDISDLKETELELEQSNQRFRSAFDDAPIGMAVTLPTGEFIQVNRALTELLGRDEQTLLSMSVQDLTHPDDREPAERQRQSLLRGVTGRRRHETRFLHADGAVVGILHSSSAVQDASGGPAMLIDHIEDITDRKAFEAMLQHQVLHDTLTGLPNRALLVDRLNQTLSAVGGGGPSVAVLFCDLDRFKAINDTHGHQAGDSVLTEVARRLQSAVRPSDTVARLSGDEFVILCQEATGEQASAAASRILAALDAPILVGDIEVFVTASIGIALSDPEHTSSSALLRDADDAMYAAKEQGRNRSSIYDKAIGVQVRTRAQLESDLLRGIRDGQLRLHYQPEMSLADRQVVGLEALVRWQHPTRGLLMPGEFIDLAEDTGLIIDLGAWVMQEALREVVRRRAAGIAAPVMWVNVSAFELRSPDFAASVGRALADHELPGSVLGLEITESVLMVNLDRARTTLALLRSMGVHLAIDDFGTGYSSLSYLAQFPVDTIKIDGSFTAGLDDNARRRESFAVVNAVIGLAHALKLRVVAEGIETSSQAQSLHGLGCDYGQGYLLGRPSEHGSASASSPPLDSGEPLATAVSL